MTRQQKIEGMVEYQGSVVPVNITLYTDGHFSVYQDNDLHDGYESLEEYVAEFKDRIYPDLKAYKENKGRSISEWVKSTGWNEV
jgi:hypothetical protein